jgi:hypothetical protein
MTWGGTSGRPQGIVLRDTGPLALAVMYGESGLLGFGLRRCRPCIGPGKLLEL